MITLDELAALRERIRELSSDEKALLECERRAIRYTRSRIPARVLNAAPRFFRPDVKRALEDRLLHLELKRGRR